MRAAGLSYHTTKILRPYSTPKQKTTLNVNTVEIRTPILKQHSLI